jgi:hypothetical protein
LAVPELILKLAIIMSLLNLVHKNVVIKFADLAKNQFEPEISYVFRLTGVDAMGFLHIQDLKPGAEAGHYETTSEPYWINKDIVREIHELNSAKFKEALHYHHQHSRGKAAPVTEPARRATLPKAEKVKVPAKQKPS